MNWHISDSVSILDRQLVCSNDECLPAQRIRNLQQMIVYSLSALCGMVPEDRDYFQCAAFADVIRGMAIEREALRNGEVY